MCSPTTKLNWQPRGYDRRIFKYKVYKKFCCDLWGQLFLKNVRHRVLRCLFFENGLLPMYFLWNRKQFLPRNLYIKDKVNVSKWETNLFKIIANFKQRVIRRQKQKTAFFKRFFLLRKLRIFYGNLRLYTFRKIITYLHHGNIFTRAYNFILLLESRLCVLLYRLWFFRTMFESISKIKQALVFVNGQIMRHPNYTLSDGDFVFLHPRAAPRIRMQIFYRLLFLNNYIFPPNYTEVNYRTCSFFFFYLLSISKI